MRVMLLHKLAEDIPEDYVPPQKLIATLGRAAQEERLRRQLEGGENARGERVLARGAVPRTS